jgi:hypothetical protein
MHSRLNVSTLGRRGAPVLLGVAVAAAAILLISLDSHLTFFADDWGLLLRKQAWTVDTFLEPYGEHLILGPVFVFKVLQELFGMGSALPFYLVSIALYLGTAVLLFFYLRSRIGDWLALIAAVLILFLGAAFEDLLWISPLNFSGSMMAGLGMLLALDRDDARGDRIACLLLFTSIAFSSVGLAFAAGALVDLNLGRRPRAGRAYVVLGPLALYAIWWLGWGHNAKTQASFSTVWELPRFVADSAAAGFTSLLGLATGDGSEASQPNLIWGRLVLAIAAIAVVVRVVRLRRLPRGLAVVLAIALAFWISTGILPNAAGTVEHAPTSSRYQLMSAVFLLLILGEAIRGLRVPAPAVVVTAMVAALAVVGGQHLLHREYNQRWRPFAGSTRYSLAAVQIAGEGAQPGFLVSFPPTLSVTDRTYLAAVHDHGSPAYGEGKLAAASPEARASADLTIAQALGLALQAPEPSAHVLRCQTVQASAEGETGVCSCTEASRSRTAVVPRSKCCSPASPTSFRSASARSKPAPRRRFGFPWTDRVGPGGWDFAAAASAPPNWARPTGARS